MLIIHYSISTITDKKSPIMLWKNNILHTYARSPYLKLTILQITKAFFFFLYMCAYIHENLMAFLFNYYTNNRSTSYCLPQKVSQWKAQLKAACPGEVFSSQLKNKSGISTCICLTVKYGCVKKILPLLKCKLQIYKYKIFISAFLPGLEIFAGLTLKSTGTEWPAIFTQ